MNTFQYKYILSKVLGVAIMKIIMLVIYLKFNWFWSYIPIEM